MTKEGLQPFLDAVQSLTEREPTRFLTKEVEAAFVVLIIREGDELRGAVATINADETDAMVGAVTLAEVAEMGLVDIIPKEMSNAKALN